MKAPFLATTLFLMALPILVAAEFAPAPQQFRQEVARTFGPADGLPAGKPQLLDCLPGGQCTVLVNGRWHVWGGQRWAAIPTPEAAGRDQFTVLNAVGEPNVVQVPWREVIQVARQGETAFISTSNRILSLRAGNLNDLQWPRDRRIYQVAVGDSGEVNVASSEGLFSLASGTWMKLKAVDAVGRDWAAAEVRAASFDSKGRLWIGTRAGAGFREGNAWRFYEGKDGLPWNDFTWITAGPGGEIWFGTRLGAIRFENGEWHYRQGPCWLANDEVNQVVVDGAGTAWFAANGALCTIQRRQMSLAEKARIFEDEIASYIKRTPYGFVAEAALKRPGDLSSADPHDSDNDGLWTAMYGAGECFAYAATGDPQFKARAKQAFEALRFLQKVTQGGTPEPPAGFIARTVRPIDWPDPNAGRLERDREEQKSDRLWKVYEPRWPKSADGKWYWKSDTSSDELDGHYFLYPLYFEFCADTEAEKERVRDVVRGITDHLMAHDFALVDHDGKPTRWGVYGPKALNQETDWWQERGLKSLSLLSYLTVANYVTGDPKYTAAVRQLVDLHGYAHNAMHSKVQHGPGSGNQSDDEMAFMCFYNLLRYSKDEQLKGMIRVSFYRHWVNEAPEMNPFFNFAYAAHCLTAKGNTPWGDFPLAPWPGWHTDAIATLYGFPLDRLDWPHRNSHRLDIVKLPPIMSSDITEPDPQARRGYRTNGKVLPVENRHFGHWNTDPWRLDYGGNSGELSAGTVFLLPYYLGLYHGFVAKP